MAIFSGDIFAENYTVSSSVTNVQISSISGSTKSGDSVDDIHQFTGSLSVNGNVTLPSTSHKIGIGITPTEELHIGGGSSRVLLVHSTGGTTQIISRKDGNQIRLLANGANPILGYGNSSGGARNLLITSNDTTVATFTSGGDLLMSDGNDISGSSTSTGSFGTVESSTATIPTLFGNIRGTSGGGWYLNSAAPSHVVPAFTFVDDTNTGIGQDGADNLTLIAGGAEIGNIKSTGLLVKAGNIELTSANGNISGSSTSTGSFGAIGIGTIPSDYKLNVEGTVRISGTTLYHNTNNPQYIWNSGNLSFRYGTPNSTSQIFRLRSTKIESLKEHHFTGGDILTTHDIISTKTNGLISGSATSTGSFGSVMQNGKHFPQVNSTGESFGFGTNAGSSFVGDSVNKINIAIGSNAGTAMADYGGNVFIGKNAAKLRTRGDSNVCIGTSAGGIDGDDFGDKNVFIGLSTGLAINSTYSDANVFLGNLAGTAGQQSIANVLIGSDAGKTLTNSARNVAIGAFAGTGFGVTNTITENSIYIGQYARTSVTNANNEIVIGSEAVGKGSNTALIGDDNITDIYMSEDVGATLHTGTVSGSATSTGSFGAIQSAGNITPKVDDSVDLGAADKRFKNIFTTDLQLSNEGKDKGNEVDGTTGSWTIQEGEEELYLLNRKNGKKYKFMLQEIK